MIIRALHRNVLVQGHILLVGAVLTGLLATGGVVAGIKTDRVLISNGDRLEGEIKQLERGSLRFNTTATDTIGIRQDLVLRLTSPRRFEVETESGERYFGHLDEPASDRMLRVVADDQVHDFDLDEVVRIYPIESKFLKRIDGFVSAGFNTTASSDVSRFTFGSNVEYSAERYNVYASLSSITTEQESGSTSRSDLTAGSQRRIGRRWFTVATGSLQTNEDLGIELRTLFAGGFGRYVVQTTQNELTIAAGAAFNRENFEGDEPSDSNWEGIVVTEYSIFKNVPREISLTARLNLFPGITQSSRLRSEFNLEYEHEIVNDLTLQLTFYSSTDSEPPPDSDKKDYGITSSVAWTF